MIFRALVFLSLAASLTHAATTCKCEFTFSACDEVAASNLVFIGTVVSLDPIFFSRWNMASPSQLGSLNQAYAAAQANPSASALSKLKETYLKVFPDMPAPDKTLLPNEKEIPGIVSRFYSALDRGVRVRFTVKTLYKNKDDDNDDDEKLTSIDLWTPFGECGSDFQLGETYLVYANRDEDSDYIFTCSCTRTRRLSDASQDLGYLFFYKNDREKSAQLEGFATTDPLAQTNSIPSPVAGIVVELKSSSLRRYTQTASNGRFVFDGLPEDSYRLSVFPAGFPSDSELLSGPQTVRIQSKSCSHENLVLPKR